MTGRDGSKARALVVTFAFAFAGCLQDYDQFDFGGDGAPTTSSASTASSSGSFSSTVSSSGGSTVNSTASSTATSTASSTASSSSTGGGVTVACLGDTCDVSAGEVCCVTSPTTATCETSCNSAIPVECDEPADCPGEFCCVLKNGINTDAVECRMECMGNDEDRICEDDGDCVIGGCEPNTDLPAGYDNCEP